ncbi:hypothetical protein Acr_22g0009370 [Actinidia rufa]|uniref:Uncharacterized protein n=1 Tax=Actinidia rufa TaxID=165716 RepID=A0A7J0GL45_9ERIC|nr:hypothetical protein Acr_22g0009370 [Actinidia rufa]
MTGVATCHGHDHRRLQTRSGPWEGNIGQSFHRTTKVRVWQGPLSHGIWFTHLLPQADSNTHDRRGKSGELHIPPAAFAKSSTSKVIGVQHVYWILFLAFQCMFMGKCRNAPNVRILNGVQADDSVRAPTNPLFIGVGFEDVNLIVANYIGETNKELGLAAASQNA